MLQDETFTSSLITFRVNASYSDSFFVSEWQFLHGALYLNAYGE
jgi:hypothetical protein